MTEIASLFAKIGADITGLEKGLNDSISKMRQTGDSMAKAGKTMTTRLSLPLALLGGAALKMASDFDQSMRNVNSILLLTEDQFQGMKEEVIKFSTTTRSSATEVADALLDVAAAGFRGDDAMLLMQKSARAAGAAFTSASNMARLLGGAINAYGLEVSEADRLTDLFIFTMQEGGGSVDSLSQNLGRVFPTAKAASVSIMELSAAVSVLGRAGFSTEEATTSLNQVFVSILKPSEALEEVFRGLGFESGQAAVEALGFAGVMQVLAEQTGGAGDVLAEMFPNIRALRGAMLLTADGADQLAGAVENFGENAEGAMERARVQQYESLESNVKRLMNAFKVLAVTIGNVLIPFLTKLITENIEPLRDWIQGLTEDQIKWGLSIAGIVAVAGPLLLILGNLIKLFAGVGGAIRLAVVALPGLIGGITTLTTGLGLLQAGVPALTVASMGMAGLAAVALPLIAIIGALVAVWIAYNQTVKKAATEGQADVKDAFEDLFQTIVEEGGNAMDVADEWDASWKRMIQTWEESNVVARQFVDLEEMLASGAQEAADAIFTAAGSYDEYAAAMEAAGLEQAKLSRGVFVHAKELQEMGSDLKKSEGQQDAWTDAMEDGVLTMEELDAIMAEMAATQEELNSTIVESKDLFDLASQSLMAYGAEGANVDAVLQELQLALGLITQAQIDAAAEIDFLSRAFAAGAISGEDYIKFLKQVQEGTLELTQAQKNAIHFQTVQAEKAEEQARALEAAAVAAEALAVKQLQLAEALKDATDAQIAQAAISELTALYQAGEISFDDYMTAVTQTQETFGLADAESRALAEGLVALTQAVADGTLAAEDFDEALQLLIDDAADGETDIQGIIDSFADITTAAGDAGGGVTDMARELNEGLEDGAAAAEEAAGTIEEAFDKDWEAPGQAIAQGIAAGITAGTPAIEAAARAAAQAAFRAAMEALEASSPSKKFQRVGRFVTEGFGMGIMEDISGMQSMVADAFSFGAFDIAPGAGATVPPDVSGGLPTGGGVGDNFEINVPIDTTGLDEGNIPAWLLDPDLLAATVAERVADQVRERGRR